jgi:SpoVK/Ycf46/Vps4 family AAA+-type ATPase
LGATNKPEVLNQAILGRFGDHSIQFNPLDEKARCEILKSTKAPCSLSDEEWESLSQRLDGWSGRRIVSFLQTVANIVEDAGAEEGCTAPRPILLSDFETQLAAQVETIDSIMSPEAKAMFIRDWCCKIFCARIDDKTGSDQRVISLRYMIESFPDSQLKSLGAKDIKQLRTNPKYSIKTQETTFLDTLTACFQEAFKDDDGKSMVEIIDNNTAREKTFVVRVEKKNGSGQVYEYATTVTKAKTRGYYFTNLQFKTRL